MTPSTKAAIEAAARELALWTVRNQTELLTVKRASEIITRHLAEHLGGKHLPLGHEFVPCNHGDDCCHYASGHGTPQYRSCGRTQREHR